MPGDNSSWAGASDGVSGASVSVMVSEGQQKHDFKRPSHDERRQRSVVEASRRGSISRLELKAACRAASGELDPTWRRCRRRRFFDLLAPRRRGLRGRSLGPTVTSRSPGLAHLLVPQEVTKIDAASFRDVDSLHGGRSCWRARSARPRHLLDQSGATGISVACLRNAFKHAGGGISRFVRGRLLLG